MIKKKNTNTSMVEFENLLDVFKELKYIELNKLMGEVDENNND